MTTFDSDLSYDSFGGYGGVGTALAHSTIELGSFVMTGAADEIGVEWFVEELKGWDSPDVRSGSTPRPEDDGLFLPAFRHGGRLLELVGRAVAPSADVAFDTKNALMAAVNLRRSIVLVVTEDRSRQVVVTRSDRLLLAQRSRLLTFSIPLLAADPRKYATEETTVEGDVAEEVTFTNEGTVATRATAVITGPVDYPALVNVTTGEEVAFDVTLAGGDELELDFDMRTAVSDGASYRSTLASGSRWWELGPGDSVLRLDADTSGVGAGVTVTARSAWI